MYRVTHIGNAYKCTKNMNTKNNDINLAPYGCIGELAKLSGCCRKTVYNAIRRNGRGEKAEKIRELYRAKYLTNK